MRHFSQKLRSCIAFANFANEHKIKPPDLAELIALADKAFSAGERECNTNKSAANARLAFEKKAVECGFSTEWNGLGPTLRKTRGDSTYDIYLPN